MINKRQKGRKLVKEILQRLKEAKIHAYEIVGSGSGLEKGDIRVPSADLVIEAKKQKVVKIQEWVKQSKKEGLGYNKTALIWQVPKTPEIRADIELDYFIELLKRAAEPKIKQDDRELKYQLQRLKIIINQILKRL